MKNENVNHNVLLGNNIRAARKQQKISLKELSKGANMSTSYLSLLERGEVNISVNNLRKIADFLDVTMVNFFEEDTVQKNGHVTRKK